MFIKTTDLKTFSFCMLGISAATLITFSQTNDTPKVEVAATAQTEIPVTRTITDTKGRSLEGTIINKSDTTITFQLAGGGKPVEVKLDTLSPNDLAFIDTLVKPDPLATVVPKKVSVLLIRCQPYPEVADTVAWLKNNGFDVTIGSLFDTSSTIESYLKSMRENVLSEKVALITQPADTDAYEVVWIPRFSTSDGHGSGIKGPSFFDVANHRNKSNKTIVCAMQKARARKMLFVSSEAYYSVNKTATGAKRYNEKDDTFIKVDENWFFYDHTIDEKTKAALLGKITESR